MKFTLSWLKDHLETSADLSEILDALNMIGLEVEDVDDKSALQPFVIAKVLSAEKHPDADKLRVLSVDTGSGEPVQVVCGAPNAETGLIGAFAAPGTYVPGLDVTLSVGKIRGVESYGMMCSERELQMSDEHDGIISLPDDAPIGTPFADYAELNDPVIEIGITPNRPDALGVAGIARDLAAYGIGEVKTPTPKPVKGDGPCPVSVNIAAEASEFCPAFGLRLVRGVKNGPSPAWMQKRLLAIGLRPINALVDMTNYITFDRGRPLHVFDAAKVHGNLEVRRAKGGEEIAGLDGKTYTLSEKHFAIYDDNGPESIAGIMGGEASGCDETTTDVLIESALWDPLTVARTGRDLGIITDARYRFERGVDPAFMAPGLDMATQMVLDMCGGEASETTIAGEIPQPDLIIDFPITEVKRLTNIEVKFNEVKAILTLLGFWVAGQPTEANGHKVKVAVPSWRPDVFGKADLVEEVMRIHGVNKIAPVPLPPTGRVGQAILTTGQIRTRNARRALAARGLVEAVTWSFISEADAQLFGGGAEALKVENPISADMSDMRPSLLPSLMRGAQRNANKGIADSALFEVSHVFSSDQPDGQHRCAAGIRRATATGADNGRHWSGNASTVTAYDAQADAIAALEACGLDTSKVQIVAGGPDWYHPGRSGTIQLGPKMKLAHFGELHPRTLEAMDVSGPMVGFEIWLDNMPAPKKKATRTKPIFDATSLQAVKRDFAFVLGSDVEAAKLLRAASGADKKLISDVSIFDIYEGERLGEGRKSVAIEVTIQPQNKTLTDEEIEAISAKIVANVEKTTGGELRS
jgi:phenylalanyl-tRNA synthetase beta chain